MVGGFVFSEEISPVDTKRPKGAQLTHPDDGGRSLFRGSFHTQRCYKLRHNGADGRHDRRDQTCHQPFHLQRAAVNME